MTSNELENLVRINQLSAEPSTPEDVGRLLDFARVMLSTAESTYDLPLESRFLLAYDAAHAAARAALHAHGDRCDVRHLVFQCLGLTVGWPASKWRTLSTCHSQRNLAAYDGIIELEDDTTSELIALTRELIETVSVLPALIAARK